MKKVTMKDVAAAAGVSVAAVSRVMNGSGYVAPDKRGCRPAPRPRSLG